ncbi:nicotinate (nicotinamide) nucleotide adenylyltransferase [Imtechella halotolerans]|uniref:Probable nicotinate-nucleotide adenylyltransferase n=1 Tax=Imtechella halotolerans K1 TaxID=946077 RepID=I0WJT4_9FLAO|nr:nicotinate (nicotinamide) nucleotide adenylyltransferase [Imtechella halotolerans]EID76650.1 nicotinic acid mononucleotide adenylyltransferase [Imtechella halotolerans K1]WMQ62781.1 nicotinate (nicotinamide) nucleotide adenylyltransferase [Imtechella halotolerans]
MKKIGLFFGTFNPIHIGHLAIANHIAEHSDLNEIWLVVTPHNPFKKKTSLLDNYHRLEMVYLAIEGYDKLKPSDIEFRLPQPNYTTHTLAYLQEKHPNYEFALIMGEDNLNSFHKWKNYQAILEHHQIYVYPRLTSNLEQSMVPETNIHRIKAPIMEISATFIREEIKNGKNIKPLLPSKVWNYIDEMNFYR